MPGRRGLDCAKPDCTSKVKSDDLQLECEKCKGIFHLCCSEVTEAAYTAITHDSLLESFIWCCGVCRPKARKAINMIDILEKRLDDMEKNLKNFKTEMNERLQKIENTVDKKESDVSSLVDGKIKTIEQKFPSLRRVSILEKKAKDIEEEKDKKRRANNLILYNVPENTSAIIDERVKHDLVTIKKMFDDKNLQIKSKDIINVFRLGKDQSKGHPRPVLVKFSKEEIKKNVLSHCKDLKLKINNESIPIYYSSDKTIKEREERRKLVEELKKKEVMVKAKLESEMAKLLLY